jgi:sulfur relay (sulfurtransferase) complex TusBCD TusD component (DsrE family)
MRTNDVILFTRFGLGEGLAALQQALVVKFLALLLESGELPARMLFYTEGVRLACTGSPVLDALKQLEAQGVELVLCKTCLDYLGLANEVQAGVVVGMTDILESIQKAPKIVSV